MPTIAIISLHNHNIETFYDDIAPNQKKYGGPWGWSDHTVHVQVPEGIDKDILKAVKTQEGTYEFTIDEDKKAAKIANQWTSVRYQRNDKLKESDWSQFADVPLTAEKKQEWMVYRQALRDFPGSLTDEEVMNLGGLVWPERP